MITAPEPVRTSPERLPAAPPDARSARAAAAIAIGTPAFLVASAIALFLDWWVGIPVVLVTSIAGVLLVNRAVSRGLVVDEDADAVERMLREHERSYPQTLTGIDTELRLIAAWTRAAARAATERTLTLSRRLHASGSLQLAPIARSVQAALHSGGDALYGARRGR